MAKKESMDVFKTEGNDKSRLVYSSKSFHSALLDEQANKIFSLKKENKKLLRALKKRDEKVRLLIGSRGEKALECAQLRAELDVMKREKDEVIEDLAKELKHSKEREEELLATVKDYLSEIEGLKSGKSFKKKNHRDGVVIIGKDASPVVVMSVFKKFIDNNIPF